MDSPRAESSFLRRENEFEFLWFATGMAGLAALLSSPLWLPLARIFDCPMQSMFDLPCVLCGGTRSAISLSHGHIAEAVAFNPLVALGLAGFALYWLNCVALLFSGRGFHFRLNRFGQSRQKLLRWSLVALIGLNWLYLILASR